MLVKKKAKKKRISVEEPVFEDYELNFCETCFQMTNHIDGICQKCLKLDEIIKHKKNGR